MRNLLTIIFLGAVSLLYAQQESPDVRLGNKQYNDSNYVDAEVNYRRAVDKNDQSFEAHYNLGDALFRQEKTLFRTQVCRQARTGGGYRTDSACRSGSSHSMQFSAAAYIRSAKRRSAQQIAQLYKIPL